ncbi:hypothetical protein ACFY2M_19105 [Streptomyces sp. NPDC001276]|uniref:hypothetical protein n=1 Tax=Streptomyces sp. NPDC001276 TaxID=3364555 RepID=UPI0036D006A8
MTTPSPRVHRDLAWALRQQARRAGEQAPTVRGSDWRQAIVQTVNKDGTVTTTDGIVARRLQTYQAPAVGDVIIVTISSSGNWLAAGRLASGDGGWTPFSLATGWTAIASYNTPSYRLYPDGTAGLCGIGTMSGAIAAGVTVATLPPEATPLKNSRVTVSVGPGYFGVMTVTSGGEVTLTDYNPALPSTGTKYAQFDALSKYRLA